PPGERLVGDRLSDASSQLSDLFEQQALVLEFSGEIHHDAAGHRSSLGPGGRLRVCLVSALLEKRSGFPAGDGELKSAFGERFEQLNEPANRLVSQVRHTATTSDPEIQPGA